MGALQGYIFDGCSKSFDDGHAIRLTAIAVLREKIALRLKRPAGLPWPTEVKRIIDSEAIIQGGSPFRV